MNESRKSNSLEITAAWLVVLIPLSWGVYMSSRNAMKLFAAPVHAVSTARAFPGPAALK
ncbi:MFS transporter small subunit [Terracidiphilus sp.]|jgi:hypothetical protein|uniref:MFS transporter small subunit n=1 Tax=Terracidiphilus sp. TaxID=1964191 RepID=UPI003C74881E